MQKRHAQSSDLLEIVAIYNDSAAISALRAAAGTEPATGAAREPLLRDFDLVHRPLWAHTDSATSIAQGCVSMRSLYGGPAYHTAVEGVGEEPGARRAGERNFAIPGRRIR